MDRVGTTTTFLGESPATCSAAMTMFLLLGRRMIPGASDSATALMRSSAEGFIDCPPATNGPAPKLRKSSLNPSPATTGMTCVSPTTTGACLLYTSDAADDLLCV